MFVLTLRWSEYSKNKNIGDKAALSSKFSVKIQILAKIQNVLKINIKYSINHGTTWELKLQRKLEVG